MSSTYSVLCLSHDPAIDVSPDNFPSLDTAVADVVERGEHPLCDLVIGEYSYPLIKVWCPPGCRPDRVTPGHRDAKAFSEPWLNLMWRSYAAVVDPARDHERLDEFGQSLRAAVIRAMEAEQCWTWERVKRLRNMVRNEQ